MIHIFQILKDRDGLTTLSHHLDTVSTAWNIEQKDLLQLNLILDELITNIIEHGGGCSKCPIEIELKKTNSQYQVTLSDGGPPFDPTLCKTTDVTLPMNERKCGGLGILFVRKFSDYCRYQRKDDKNIFYFTKTYTRSAE